MIVAVRLIALAFVTLALMLLGADLITTLESGKFTTRSVSEVWSLIDKNGPADALSWASHRMPPLAANALRTLLSFWGWAVVGPIGCVLLLLVGRRNGD